MDTLDTYLDSDAELAPRAEAQRFTDALKASVAMKKEAGFRGIVRPGRQMVQAGIRATSAVAHEAPAGVRRNVASAIATQPSLAAKATTGLVPPIRAGQSTHLSTSKMGGPKTYVAQPHGMPKQAGVGDFVRKIVGAGKGMADEAAEQGRGYMLGASGLRDAGGNAIAEPGKLKAWLSQHHMWRGGPQYTHEQIALARSKDPRFPHGAAFLAGFRNGQAANAGVGSRDLIGELNQTFRRPDGKLTALSALTGAQQSGMLSPEGIANAAKNTREFVSGASKNAETEARRRAIMAGVGAGGAGLAGGAYLAHRLGRQQQE